MDMTFEKDYNNIRNKYFTPDSEDKIINRYK